VLAEPDFIGKPIEEVMTREPMTVSGDDLAAAAWRIMRERNFDELPVVDGEGMYRGLLDIQDLLRAGFEEGERP
jgi:arabinose-5-phosphate isomerase